MDFAFMHIKVLFFITCGQFHRAVKQISLGTSQTFIQNVCILAGSLFYIA